MGNGFSIGQKPGGGDKPIPVGDIKTGLASERGGKQGGRPSEGTALCLVSRDQAPSNGVPPLRVLCLLSLGLQPLLADPWTLAWWQPTVPCGSGQTGQS